MRVESVDASVIIPCYQSAETIEEQLDAVMAQQWDGRWEVICAYQPSSDETRVILDRYAQQYPNLSVVEAAERYHPSYARNVGVAAARGDWLLFCDADDVVRPGWIAALANALKDAEIVAGALDSHSLNSVEIAGSRAELDPVQTWGGYIDHAAGGNLGLRRALYDRLGGFSEEPPALEDTDFTFRAQLDGGATIVAAHDAIVEYRYRDRLSDIAAQARSYGRAEIWLRKRFESRGMPPLTLWQLVRGWGGLLVLTPTLLISSRRPGFARRWGYRLGQLGAMFSLRYRPHLRSGAKPIA